MKHNLKITIIILSMFLLTQFIGLYVVDYYAQQRVIEGSQINIENFNDLPYGMQNSISEASEKQEMGILSFAISFLFAVLLILFLTRIRAKFVMKLWFLIVVILALGISLTSILPSWSYVSLIALVIALPIAILKVYGRNFLAHNLSELLIYPGIAAIFVPILNLIGIIILLVLISLYDMWAVWKSGIMQKMAKYQMDNLKVFAGFYVPYLTKTQRGKLISMKKKGKDLKKIKMKVNVAILGGGDVVFPIIASGVVLKTWGIWPAIGVIFGALLGLGFLLLKSEKKKFYPAMPFITTGIFISMVISWVIIYVF